MSRGALALTLLGAVFLMPRAVIARPEATSAKYHLLRFYGAKPKAPKSVIDVEIDKAADREGLPRKLFHALVTVESAKNPKALSNMGARGIAQVTPPTARRCGIHNPNKLFDLVIGASCGAKILRQELDTYGGNVRKALEAYNGGHKCLGRCKESVQYANKIIGMIGNG